MNKGARFGCERLDGERIGFRSKVVVENHVTDGLYFTCRAFCDIVEVPFFLFPPPSSTARALRG